MYICICVSSGTPSHDEQPTVTVTVTENLLKHKRSMFNPYYHVKNHYARNHCDDSSNQHTHHIPSCDLLSHYGASSANYREWSDSNRLALFALGPVKINFNHGEIAIFGPCNWKNAKYELPPDLEVPHDFVCPVT